MVLASVPAAEGVGWPEALPLLPHPAELIIGLIAFGILYWIFATKIVPKMEAMYDERAAGRFASYFRASASPGAALAVWQMNREIDVSPDRVSGPKSVAKRFNWRLTSSHSTGTAVRSSGMTPWSGSTGPSSM